MSDDLAAPTLRMLGGLLLQHIALSIVSIVAAAGLALLVVALSLHLRRLYRLVSKGPAVAVAPILAVSFLIAATLFLPGRTLSPGLIPSPFAFAVLMLSLGPGILLSRSAVLAMEAVDEIYGDTSVALALTPFQRKLLILLPQARPAILDAAQTMGRWIISAATLAPLIGQPSLGQAMVLRRFPADWITALGALALLAAILWTWNAAMKHLRSKVAVR